MGKNVLIADDNHRVQRALRNLLTHELNVQVYEARQGKEVVQKAVELQLDVIVLDVSMPLMNGIEAARAIKRTLPLVPLIMYSMFVNELARQEAQSLGISELVSKSEHASVLIQKLRHLLYPAAA